MANEAFRYDVTIRLTAEPRQREAVLTSRINGVSTFVGRAPLGDGAIRIAVVATPAGRVVVDAPFGKLQALSVHLHPPVSDGGSFVSGYFTTPRIRVQEIQTFFARLDPAMATVIAGDFNEEADDDVTAFLTGKGFISALPRWAPDQPTWRWATGVGTLRKQLDHVVHNRRLEVVALTILDAGRSDHLPVLAVLRAVRAE